MIAEESILAESLRIETVNDVATPLIPKGTALPASVVETFTTAVDNQPVVAIHLLEGDHERTERCRNLGRFELGGISPQAKGVPQIRFSLEVSSDGRMNIEVQELGRDNNKTIEGPNLRVLRH
jgi:molecular chaperone DnaK